MVNSTYGLFTQYPEEWLSKVPFESWFIPGIIAIVVFALGNVIAAIFSFRKNDTKSWFTSVVMGLIFFISLVSQVIILGKWYMATAEFLIFSIIQLSLSTYAFAGYRKNLTRSNI